MFLFIQPGRNSGCCFLVLFVSKEVAVVALGSIPSAPVVPSHYRARGLFFFPPHYQTLEAKYSLNSSCQEKESIFLCFKGGCVIS